MVDIKELRDKITIENVKFQIADGWKSSHVIAENIIGRHIWNSLPEWDRIILNANVHKVIRENNLL